MTVTKNVTQGSRVVGGSAAHALTQGSSVSSTASLVGSVGVHSKHINEYLLIDVMVTLFAICYYG